MPHGGIHFAVNRPLGGICPAVPVNLIDPAFTYASFGFEEAGNQYQCSKQNSGPASLMDIYDACPYKKCPQQPPQQPAEPGDQFFIFIQCRSFLMYTVKIAIARPGHGDKDHSSDQATPCHSHTKCCYSWQEFPWRKKLAGCTQLPLFL